MRVIGGNARGRRLKVPKGQTLRPTAARVKEALFNILPHDLSGANALDLFAGTGNLTIEALSRGATAAILEFGQEPGKGPTLRFVLVAGERLDLDPLAPEPGERGVDLVPAFEAQPLRAGEET